ncbi:hypothetical protein ACIBG8_45175 [Nonomuraea sp. NPDC050556]|uniref:hypothetical protein n=1 Tax=Nonomuraea sp. NPDC050556 TaxID=3364369 RepID=UPI0037AD05AC
MLLGLGLVAVPAASATPVSAADDLADDWSRRSGLLPAYAGDRCPGHERHQRERLDRPRNLRLCLGAWSATGKLTATPTGNGYGTAGYTFSAASTGHTLTITYLVDASLHPATMATAEVQVFS